MKKISILFLTCLLLLLNRQSTFAASTTMGLSPSSGTFGKPFTVNLVIDGHGDRFNAAQATVALSQNLAIQDLTLGDCNFSFLKTPSIQNPSFEGVIVSTYATKCTIYTLTLIPTAKGHGSITLSHASVRHYGDAAEVLSSTENGSYTLSAALQAPTNALMQNTSQNDLYTLHIKVTGANNTPVSNATVIITHIDSKQQTQASVDKTELANFSKLKPGLYDVVVQEGSNKVGETVVNVSGTNHVITVGINLATQKTNPLMKTKPEGNTLTTNPFIIIGLLLVGITLGVAGATFIPKWLRGKRT